MIAWPRSEVGPRLLSRAARGFLSLAFLVSCSAKEDRAQAPAAQRGGSDARGGSEASGGSNGGTSGASGGAAGGENSSAGEGGVGGSAGSGGEAGEGGAPGPSVPAQCAPSAAFGEPRRIAVSTAEDDDLGSITPDELTIAWTAGEKAFVADRARVDAAFGDAMEVPGSSAYFARVITSPDGLRLIAVRLDGTSFGLLTRAARGEPFEGELDESPFAALESGAPDLFSAAPVADAIFDAAGKRVLYSALDTQADGFSTIYESNFASGILPWGIPVQGTLLFAVEGAFRRPSGLSADGRTLFYWDEVSAESRAAWRPSRDRAFENSERLPEYRNVVPNTACDRIYFSFAGEQGRDLFYADRQ